MTGDPAIIADAIVAVGLFEEDFEYASSLIMEGAGDANPIIRGAALVSIGHLARVHRRVPDFAVDLVNAALQHPDSYIRGQAEDAADDIEQFAPQMARRLRR